MFGPENYSNRPESDKSYPDDKEEITADTDAEVVSRRSFLSRFTKASIATAIAGVGLGGTEDVEAEVQEGPITFVGYRPTEHEKKLIMLKVKRVIPNAESIEVRLNKSNSRDDILSSVNLSIITSDNKVFEGVGAGFYERGSSLGGMLDRALQRLKGVK